MSKWLRPGSGLVLVLLLLMLDRHAGIGGASRAGVDRTRGLGGRNAQRHRHPLWHHRERHFIGKWSVQLELHLCGPAAHHSRRSRPAAAHRAPACTSSAMVRV